MGVICECYILVLFVSVIYMGLICLYFLEQDLIFFGMKVVVCSLLCQAGQIYKG